MILKSTVLETMQSYGEQIEADDLIEKIIILDKISKSEIQYENGEIYTQEEVENEANSWF
jgi:hypothetical protein